MLLTPRYGDDPIITLDGSPSAILEPVVRQRQRLLDILTGFTDDQWLHPSRCAGWSNRDVIVHLDSTNSFWAFSVAMGIRGEPTQFLATFDPVRSPAELVDDTATLSTAAVLSQFGASTQAFVDVLSNLEGGQWSALAEAPPGHIAVSALATHALWDSWVHERDIVIPLGVPAVEEPDEIAACLRYVAALAPAFAVSRGAALAGTLAVQADDPHVEVAIEIGEHVHVRDGFAPADLVLAGSAVDLLEALSIRQPLQQPIPEHLAWMVAGLAETFDVSVT